MKLLLYCTKAKPYLFNQNIYEFYESKYITSTHKFHEKQDYLLNGKIVAECDSEVEEITYELYGDLDWQHDYLPTTNTMDVCNLENASCLDRTEIENYLRGNNGYAIHIKNLKIFDEPKELSYYYRYCPCSYNPLQPIKVAPQNMMYAYNFKDYDEKPEYILISIRPEHLVNILNGNKTIEIRKKVLKGMIK